MLTREYRVASILFDHDRLTPLQMLPHHGGSNASFFSILKNLEAKDVVSTEPNPSDRRSKFYRLSDSALATMARQWATYNAVGRKELYEADDPSVRIRQFTKTVTSDLKVKQFTCEYQILMYLNSSPGLTNIHFKDLVDVSEAKFNESLTMLKRSGHIFHENDTADRRKKLYFLEGHIRDALEEMGERIFRWLDSKSDLFSAIHHGKP